MVSLVKWIIGLLLAFLSQIINAQEITGIWNGAIKVQGTELPVIFKIKKEGDTYISTLKSPKQSDQQQFLSNVKTLILAIGRGEDYQVIPDLNLTRIESILKKSGNKDVTINEIEGLNHLFQMVKTGSAS
ncbi:hypothetical protein ATO12_21575 [Aquimarina atlantica]|uniref:Alpha/beta hydrolase n=1 Tax=Aquimarina atlantica TaxID=1317122 RepID=A0A023BRW0_9FLAO|nr:hypothetical protein [Aquimarina atlantica]EZH72727.1 hypothetical protein ATO12_21575 [Aquimarina atlantica]